MNENRSFASLGPTLLARKGGARPAMRSQLGMTPMAASPVAADIAPAHLEDLGWNDMGADEHGMHEAEIVPFQPEVATADPVVERPEPAVREHLRAIAEHMERQGERAAAPQDREPAKPRRKSAASQGRRAAFTLRLDDQLHLKLRLASTVQNRSAQQVLVEMLDRYFAESPDIEALAAQVRRS